MRLQYFSPKSVAVTCVCAFKITAKCSTTARRVKQTFWSQQYLEDAGDDGSDIGSKPVSKGEGQVDEHHDVAISDVRRDIDLAGCLHHIWHQLVQLLHAESRHDLSQT